MCLFKITAKHQIIDMKCFIIKIIEFQLTYTMPNTFFSFLVSELYDSLKILFLVVPLIHFQNLQRMLHVKE